MKGKRLVIKPRGLNGKFITRLKEAEESTLSNSKKSYLPFPTVFEKICRSFSITKKEAWDILFVFQDFGLIDVIRGHGIKLNF